MRTLHDAWNEVPPNIQKVLIYATFIAVLVLAFMTYPRAGSGYEVRCGTFGDCDIVEAP